MVSSLVVVGWSTWVWVKTPNVPGEHPVGQPVWSGIVEWEDFMTPVMASGSIFFLKVVFLWSS